MQSRQMSLMEAAANTASGFTLSVFAGLIVYPLFGFPATLAQSFWITVLFTGLSIGRNYVCRRIFERFRGGRD